MAIHGLEKIVGEHPFFRGLAQEHIDLITGCARNALFDKGDFVEREGAPANTFHLVREGRIGLQMAVAGDPAVTFLTVKHGEVLGTSWLVPPYRFAFDALALEPTRTIALDAECLRGKCEADHSLGYDLMKRFVPVLVERMTAARLQALDIYGATA